METLPDEIIFNLALDLIIYDVTNLFVVNKRFYKVLNNWTFFSKKAEMDLKLPKSKFNVKNSTPSGRYHKIRSIFINLDNIILDSEICNNNVATIEILLNYNNCQSFINKVLLRSTAAGKLDLVNLLLNNYNADPSIGNNSPLRTAVGMFHTNLVDILLKDFRTNPSDNDNVCLEMAIKYNLYQVTLMLLNNHRLIITKQKYKDIIMLLCNNNWFHLIGILKGCQIV